MNQDQLKKIKTETWKKENIVNDVGYGVGFSRGFDVGVEVVQKEFEKELDYSKMFHCPNFVTTDNGYIACNLDKHLLQKQLEEAVEVIKEFKKFVLYHDNKYFENHLGMIESLDEFLAKVKRG
jgi:ABC-type thiamine transport system substrate-binding protein